MRTELKQECPQCLAELNRISSVGHDQGPKPGDVSVCADCGGLNVVGEKLDLEPASNEVLESLPADQRELIQKLQVRLRAMKRAKLVCKDMKMGRMGPMGPMEEPN